MLFAGEEFGEQDIVVVDRIPIVQIHADQERCLRVIELVLISQSFVDNGLFV